MKKYHTVATIDVLRHGEKTEAGELTPEGFSQAAMKAIQIDHLEGIIHACHSGNDRVMKTVSMVHNLLSKKTNYIQEAEFVEDLYNHLQGKEELFNIDSKTIPELHYLYNPSIKGDYFGSWNKTVDYKNTCQRMQNFLDFREISPEPGIVPSPKEMAQRLFGVVLNQITSVTDTRYNSRENFINGTHEPVIMSGIFYMLNYFKAGKKDFVTHIGGSVDFTEGFHIKIYQDKLDNFIYQFFFRNYVIDFSVDELKKFVNEK